MEYDAAAPTRRSARGHRPSAHGGPDNYGKKELTAAQAQMLKDWMLTHFHDPYPTPSQKRHLLQATCLQEKQLANWFNNARKRVWRPLKDGAAQG